MAVSLSADTVCVRCKQILPAGSRVKKCYNGHTHQQHCFRPAALRELAPAPAPLPATARQITYALDLLRASPEPLVADAFERPTTAQVRAMSRDAISQLISDLTTEL
jgi:hypothetical protein